MDLKMPEECDTAYPHRKETGNRTDVEELLPGVAGEASLISVTLHASHLPRT